jgi:hypothetical protein
MDFSTLEPLRIIIGFLVSTVGGAVVLWLLIDRLAWPYVAEDLPSGGKPARLLTVPLGICERASYTTAILLGFPTWIGVWLAIKVAAQWQRWHGEERAVYNVFLLGNILSVFFGLLGAWIALGRVPVLTGLQ